MRFTKMHGLGNDYVYLDGFAAPPPADPATLARKVSDRHRGIGSDGLILILPSEQADARMRMFNADGSEAEMCGNGLRCVAKYVYDHGLAQKPTLTIETGRGVLTVEVEAHQGRAERIRVEMGVPILTAAEVPTTLPETRSGAVVEAPVQVEDWTGYLTAVSMGNPHAVAFVELEFLASRTPDEVARIGAQLEIHPAFPNRVNVHFVAVRSETEVTMRTWERGSGLTEACGTGACAVAVAGVLTGRTHRTLHAHLPGGDLTLEWPTDESPVFMTGPATEVFTGDWPGP